MRNPAYRFACRAVIGAAVALHCAYGHGAPKVDTEGFPRKPVRIVVPFPPGGGSDFVARLLSQKFTEAWGQPVILDNRPGASATIGTNIVAKAPADGYTLLLVTTELVIAPNFVKPLPYDVGKDFAAITQTGRQSYIVAVHPSLAATSIKELVAEVRAKQGRVNFGSSGIGSPGHLSGELFKLATDTRMTHIAYKGSGPALAALVGGETSLMFSNSLPVLPHIRSGRLRGLAITSRERLAALPDLPTVAESGVPGFETTGWTGLAAPAKTPPAVVDRIYRQTVHALSLGDVREQLARGDVEPVGSSPAEFNSHIARERVKWAEVVKKSGVTTE